MGMEQGENYFDSGGGADSAYDYGDSDSFSADIGDSDFYYGYGAGESDEYGGPIDYAPYEPQAGLEPPSLEPIPESPFGGTGDLFSDYYDFYLGIGLDPAQAAGFAAEDASAGSIEIPTLEQGLLPEVSFPFYGLPYVPDPFLTPYTPIFPDLSIPAPPVGPLPTSPATRQPNLPPACPGGTYHPYPIGHPQQNICVPFPPAQTGPSQQQKPPQQQAPAPKPPAPQQKPPAQQQKCPTGYYLDPVTRQCKLIPKCTTPGTVFDAARGICVPKAQAVSPLPEGAEGLLDELKKLPWWVWLALGGLILLSRDEDGKKTTVTYRRAR